MGAYFRSLPASPAAFSFGGAEGAGDFFPSKSVALLVGLETLRRPNGTRNLAPEFLSVAANSHSWPDKLVGLCLSVSRYLTAVGRPRARLPAANQSFRYS